MIGLANPPYKTQGFSPGLHSSSSRQSHKPGQKHLQSKTGILKGSSALVAEDLESLALPHGRWTLSQDKASLVTR